MIGFLKTEKRVGLGTNRVTKIRSPSWPSPLEWSESSKKKRVTSPFCHALTKTTSLSSPLLPLWRHSFFQSIFAHHNTTKRKKSKRERKKKKQWEVGERCQYRWKVWGTKTWCSWRNSTQPSSLSATTTSTTPTPSLPPTSPSSVSSVYLFFHCLISLSSMDFASFYSIFDGFLLYWFIRLVVVFNPRCLSFDGFSLLGFPSFLVFVV